MDDALLRALIANVKTSVEALEAAAVHNSPPITYPAVERIDPHTASCKLCQLITRLQGADRQAVETVLADPAQNHSAIARAVTARGVPVTRESVRRHRLFMQRS